MNDNAGQSLLASVVCLCFNKVDQ